MKNNRIIIGVLLVVIGSCYELHSQVKNALQAPAHFIEGSKIYYQFTENPTAFQTIKSNPNNFELGTGGVSNFGMSDKDLWLKIVLPKLEVNSPFLVINNPMLDEVTFYQKQPNGYFDSVLVSQNLPLKFRTFNSAKFIFKLNENAFTDEGVYVRVRSLEQMIIPISVRNKDDAQNNENISSIFLGIYLGIILIMFTYNLFIYFSVKDKSYLYYVMYVLFVGLTQLGIKGLNLLSPIFQSIDAQNVSLIFYANTAAFFGIVFTRDFLQLHTRLPVYDKVMKALAGIFILSVILGFFGQTSTSFIIMQIGTIVSAILIFITSVHSVVIGVKSARYFLFAWSILLLGALLFTLKDLGILPFNTLSDYTMIIASSVEMALLSFALANKINVLTIEKQEAKTRELNALKENEILIKEQNVVLESKVEERTRELSETNNELEEVLFNLKNAQTQLVSQEKMASLGQLTAGIAHEINNPINFVSSNVGPLKRDIADLIEVIEKYKSITTPEEFVSKQEEIAKLLKDIDYEYVTTEINQLVYGIEEGARRTAEIVKGLKNFSRLDEVESKKANLHEGINSTLLILLSGSKVRVEIVKNFDDEVGEIECYPGKLNQVFSNILANAFQAMEVNAPDNPAKMVITTRSLTEHVEVSFKDNGPGIPQQLIDKIFDPFFTTKEVGEGTGLGLSIVFSIIESHKGKIEVDSNPPHGTEFIITLPKVLGE